MWQAHFWLHRLKYKTANLLPLWKASMNQRTECRSYSAGATGEDAADSGDKGFEHAELLKGSSARRQMTHGSGLLTEFVLRFNLWNSWPGHNFLSLYVSHMSSSSSQRPRSDSETVTQRWTRARPSGEPQSELTHCRGALQAPLTSYH